MSGSVLVAVPGLGLGPESWQPALHALRAAGAAGDQMRIELLAGYGRPTNPPGAATPVQLAEHLGRRLRRRITLLGHSSSCQVVAHAAKLRPDLVGRLVLVAPTTDPRATSWPALAATWLRTAVHEDPRQVPLLVRQYRRTGLRSMRRTMEAARRDDILATLRDVHCPVVVVRGRHDHIARAEWARAVAAVPADGAVVELPRGAHMVPFTHPTLFAEYMAPLLRCLADPACPGVPTEADP